MDSIDDDFGDLYADVEVQATSAVVFPVAQPQDGYNGSDERKVGATKSSPVEKSLSSPERLDCVFDDSDSGDDLNIVLNDDGPSNEENDGWSFAADTSRRCTNGVSDGSVLKSSANEPRTENSPQLKYIRNNVSPCPSDMRVKGRLDLGTTSSSGRSDCHWHAHGYNHNKWGRAQFGSGFSFPWYRTILDFNIHAFHEKPWSQPGVDITDFFNFGFDEGSWKQYCKLITPEFRSEKRGGIEKAPADDDTELEPSFGVANCRENTMEGKESAILVQGGIGKRQPSMDVTNPHFRDSDVVIEISVLYSLLDSSSSHEAELDHPIREVSGHGDVEVKNNSEVVQGDISSKHLEDSVVNVHVPSFKRSLQPKTEIDQLLVKKNNCEDKNVSDLGGRCLQKVGTCTTEEIAEARVGVSKEEECVRRDICGSDICLIENRSSVSSQNRLNLTSSYSGSESLDRSDDSVESDYMRIHRPLRRQSLDSGTELRDPSSGYTTSTNDGHKTKMVGAQARSVQRSPVREKRKYGDPRMYCSPERISRGRDYNASPVMQARAHRKTYARGSSPVQETRRYDNSRKSTRVEKIYPKRRKDVYPILDVKVLDDKDHYAVDIRRHESNLPDVGYCSRDYSRYRERRHSKSYHDGRFAFSHHQTVRSKYSWPEAAWSLRENLNQDIRKTNDDHNFHKRGVLTGDHCDGESKWEHVHARLVEGSVPYSDREWRRLAFKYPSVYRHRASQEERENARFQFPRRTDGVGCLSENYPLQDRDHSSVSLDEYERDFQVRRYGGWLPEIRRETGVSKWMDPHGDTAFHLDCSRHMEDDYDRLSLRENKGSWHCDTSPQSEIYDLEFAKGFNIHKERIFRKKNKNHGPFGRHDDACDGKDSFFYDDNQVDSHRRRYGQNKLEDGFTLRHQDYRHAAEEESVLHERSSELEIANVKNGFRCGKMLLNNSQIEAQRCRSFTKGRLRSYDVSSRSQQKQMFLNCRDANQFVGKGKCHGSDYYDRTLSDHSNKKMDMKFLKESSCNGLSDHRGAKRTKNSLPSTKGNSNDKKERIKLPVIQQNDELDIEEGQIVVEENAVGKNNHVPETASASGNVNKTLQQGSSFGKEKAKDEYDSDWILKSLAKMEKRRERFKDPVAVTRQTDDTLKPVAPMVVDGDIAKVKQDRPARKRTWGELNMPTSKSFSLTSF